MTNDTILFTSGGTPVTQDMLDQLGDQWESGDYPGDGWGPVRRGRPLTVGVTKRAKTIGLRLDEKRDEKLNRLAHERHTNRSEVLRQLIDAA
jgi:hypothetical protein